MKTKAINLADGDILISSIEERFVVSEVLIHENIGPDNFTMVACRLRPEFGREHHGWRDAFRADEEITVISPPELFRELA